MRRAISRGNSRDEVIDAFAKEFNLTSMFFADFDNSDLTARDSSEVAAKDIYADEFHDRVTMPRMVMFDACYNGSFHEDDYIAGEYIFNPGGNCGHSGKYTQCASGPLDHRDDRSPLARSTSRTV